MWSAFLKCLIGNPWATKRYIYYLLAGAFVILMIGCGGGTRGTGSSVLELKLFSEDSIPLSNLPVEITVFTNESVLFDQVESSTDEEGLLLTELALPDSAPQLLFEFSTLQAQDSILVLLEASDIQSIQIELQRLPAGGFAVSRQDVIERPDNDPLSTSATNIPSSRKPRERFPENNVVNARPQSEQQTEVSHVYDHFPENEEVT